MPAVLGLNAKLYAKVTSGTQTPKSYGESTSVEWVELTNVRDVTLNMTKGEADVTVRANNGWKAMIGTLKDASVDFEMVWDTSDAGFKIMKNAFMDNAIVGLLILDGSRTVDGSEGLMVDCSITQFNRGEPLEEALKVSVTAKPTYSPNRPPTWVTGNDTYTAAQPPL